MIKSKRLLALAVGAAWALALLSQAFARDPIFPCFFAGTTSNNDLFVSTTPQDISGSQRVVLYGVRVPPSASSAFNKYVQKMLSGNLLHVRRKKRLETRMMSSIVGEVMIVQGRDYVNFNKSLLRDGYGQLSSDAPSDYKKFVDYAQRKHLGLYSMGRPNWIFPVIKREEAATTSKEFVLDRDKLIARYGVPNYSNRTMIPDNYSILQYHIYITDFYLSIGKVFIYRDGKLVNRQDDK